jgi:hypothetical protein
VSESERDPVVRRAIDELRRLPAVDANAIRRVVSAAAAARIAPADDEPIVGPVRPWFGSAWAIVGVAAVAAFVGFALRGVWTTRAQQPSTTQLATQAAPQRVTSAATRGNSLRATAATVAMPLQPVTSSASDALPIPWQFVLRDSAAHRVAVVGDFNRWNAKSAPMTRSANSALWSITIPVLPGRHTYGFMVDDSVFMLDPDPRYAKTRDADLGVEGSVVIVGRP